MRHLYIRNGRQESLEHELAGLAARHHGILTRAQIEGCGATKGLIQHRVLTGQWHRIAPGVFRLTAVPSSWRQTLMIACLVWGAGAAISHRAAAALWRLVGFDEQPVEITVPRKRKRKHGPGIIHRGALNPRDVTVLDGIPVTVPARTLLDIAAVAPRETLEEALDDAIHRGVVRISTLRRRIESAAASGRPGVRVMRGLLEARDPSMSVPNSVFETRLLRHLNRRRLPAPVPQYPISDDRGLVARVDFAWPDGRLALEADSFRWHSARTRFEHDRARRNRLTLLGWRIIHVTWDQLTRNPDSVMDDVEEALATFLR